MAPLDLDELWDKFKIDKAPSVQPTTLVTDYNQVEQWIYRCPIKKVKKGREILAWTLTQKPEKSARKVAGYIRMMYRWASSDSIGIIRKNPVKDYSMPKAPQGDEEVRVIPREKTAVVIESLKPRRGGRQADWSLYGGFMLQIGGRTGEVRALQWKDIKDGQILIHSNYTLTHGYKPSTKTNKKRRVPLNQRCMEILDSLPRDSEFIFPWDRQAFQSHFRRRMQQLKADGVIDTVLRPYDLRHTAISRWIEEGIPVTQCARWAGNTPEVIWKYYANSTQEFEAPVL